MKETDFTPPDDDDGDGIHPQHNRARSKRNGPGVGEKPFAFTWAKDIIPEPKEFLIDGFLGRRETSGWYGPPDAGKSTSIIHPACCVAAGIDFCDRHVQQAPVLYVAAERGGIVKRRIEAWCVEHNFPDIPLAVVDSAVDLRTNKIDGGRVIATAQELEAVHGQPVGWIIFDTLNRVLAGGDESSSKDMGAVIASVDQIHRTTRAHCSLIHHVPVDRTDRMRGHGSMLGALDTTVRVTKDDTGNVLVEIDVAKDLVDQPRFMFAFKSVTLFTNPETRANTTAPVMVEIEGAPPAKVSKGKSRRLPGAAQTALRALREAVDEVGAVPPVSNHVPHNVRTVTTDQWRTYAYKRGISSGEQRAREKAFERATERLTGDQMVGTWGDLYWPASKQEGRT
jgi:hypothetical protein